MERTSQYTVSYLRHIVRCTSRTWIFLWYTILHWSSWTPIWYPQWQSVVARSITSLKLLSETTLCRCHTLCFDKQFHCHNVVLSDQCSINETPNITVPWCWSVWKHCMTDGMVFKFQKPSSVFGAPCTILRVIILLLYTRLYTYVLLYTVARQFKGLGTQCFAILHVLPTNHPTITVMAVHPPPPPIKENCGDSSTTALLLLYHYNFPPSLQKFSECGVSECDREASIMRRPWPTRGCCAMGKSIIVIVHNSIAWQYVYILYVTENVASGRITQSDELRAGHAWCSSISGNMR
jgi:hypothetical protein